ncbi:hypothetical protein F2Q68_00033306 [Brassica cretica]|uniref:Uncharacterized protein n=1 Tax=Brassica cretica TaxID=69181 RepID=A0A8S9GIX5_BRACR|nr:hypothetical protein F2Q68_00033306 [Brassica cretica]
MCLAFMPLNNATSNGNMCLLARYNHPVCSEQMAVTAQGQSSQPGNNGYIPGWML